MKPRASIEHAATGVEGLDEILRGGLPVNRVYLVKGNPGVGKTTLSLQYLLEGVHRGERGLYITLSETSDEINAVARSHGWDLGAVEIFELSALEHQLDQAAQNTVFHPYEIELNKTTDILLEQIASVKPHRLVIDSLSELRLLSDTALRYRRQILSLKQFLSVRSVTTILLDDRALNGGDLHVQSIAHGVISLEQLESEYGMERRRIRITKLRGVNFMGGFHDVVIVPGGLKVFPRLVAASHERPFKAGVLSSGLPQLDLLLGGGLDRGTSCLLLGPAGTGKSSLALQFAIAAARRGEKAFVCLFEENRRTMLARAASLGMDVEGLIDSGDIELVQIDPVELAPGQFVDLIQKRVEYNDVRVVVIDSLIGYMEAMPEVDFLKIQLHELLSVLAHQGVMTLMTVAQHGILGQMQTPIDLTYLADTVILLRYFEERGRIRKAVSVVKKRIGGHENALRELVLDTKGIRVGEPLEQFHGVLTGVPTFDGKSSQMMAESRHGSNQ